MNGSWRASDIKNESKLCIISGEHFNKSYLMMIYDRIYMAKGWTRGWLRLFYTTLMACDYHRLTPSGILKVSISLHCDQKCHNSVIIVIKTGEKGDYDLIALPNVSLFSALHWVSSKQCVKGPLNGSLDIKSGLFPAINIRLELWFPQWEKCIGEKGSFCAIKLYMNLNIKCKSVGQTDILFATII